MNLRLWLTHPWALLLRLRYYVWEKMHPDYPWMCPGTVEFCAARLTKSMRVLEFGSGRSTTWFAQRVEHLTSVENRADWHGVISERLRTLQATNVDYRLIPLEHPEAEAEHAECEPMVAYVRVADEFADGSLDLVIVDGHYRNHCIRRVASKIKAGGYLLVDDVNFWEAVEQIPVPATWKIVDDSTNGLKRCIIWQNTPLAA
jgi:predicted O-methyltransferase YrrM